MTPRPKRQSQKTLKNKCDKLWSQIIRSRGRCEWCGAYGNGIRGNLEAAHIVSRTYAKTRHNLFNGICLDSACHRKAHALPTVFTGFVIELIGQEKLDELHRLAQDTSYKVDYAVVYEQLRNVPLVPQVDSVAS